MRLIGQTTVYSGWGRFLLLDVQLDSGKRVKRQLEDHGDSASVLPYDPVRRTAMVVRQARWGPLYRGLPPLVVETAAGIVDPGETPEATAAREALEELGVRLTRLEPVAALWSSPGVSSERLSLYLAPYGADDRVAAGGGLADDDEHVEVLEAPLVELLRQADSGEIADLKTLTLVWALARRRPELFA